MNDPRINKSNSLRRIQQQQKKLVDRSRMCIGKWEEEDFFPIIYLSREFLKAYSRYTYFQPLKRRVSYKKKIVRDKSTGINLRKIINQVVEIQMMSFCNHFNKFLFSLISKRLGERRRWHLQESLTVRTQKFILWLKCTLEAYMDIDLWIWT